jgi:peptide-methionine (S)-S-oxide reductase
MVKTETVILGGGCFWCTEAVFRMFKGIISTTPGYAGGNKSNPTYEQVCSGNTGHAEVLKVEYDADTISLDKILEIFFSMHDPTSADRQGADVGSQYRSMILYESEKQKYLIQKFVKIEQKKFSRSIITEVKKLSAFYPAEDHHKDYYAKNPLQPYCLLVIAPKVRKIRKEFCIK